MESVDFTQYSFVSEELNALLNTTTIAIANWQWLVIIGTLVIGTFAAPLLSYIINKIKTSHAFYKQEPRKFIGYLFWEPIQKPLSWIVVLFCYFLVGDAIGISGKFETYYNNILRLSMAIQLIKLVYYVIDASGKSLHDLAVQRQTNYDNQLIPFATKCAKIAIVFLGSLMALQSFGINVVSILAGLGLGGLALALAAQDTAANLFGSITIFLDQPFKVKDWIKVKDIEGTVESIGFRSSRIRTFYDSVVTVPNSVMAKENIDNMGVRNRRRTRQVIGLTYETPPEKVALFCDRVRSLLKENPKVHPDSIAVLFNNFNQSSLDVLVNFNLMVKTGPEEMAQQQEILLGILKISLEIGVSFAYPTQMVYQKNL